MPSGIRDLRPEYPVIEITIEGSFEYQESLAIISEAGELQDSQGIPLSLVDATNIIHATPTASVIQLADLIVKVGRPDGWKQAFLRPVDTYAAMSVDFWETAARNRGLAVRVFTDRQAALDWLMSDEDAVDT